jgi:hypothetical protein
MPDPEKNKKGGGKQYEKNKTVALGPAFFASTLPGAGNYGRQ